MSESAKKLAERCSNDELINVGRIVLLAKQHNSPYGRAVFAEMQKRIDAAETAAPDEAPLPVTVVDFGPRPRQV